MNLRRASLYRYRLPLNRPLTLGSHTIDERLGIVAALELENGLVGYGEIAPLPFFSVESLDAAAKQATAVLQFLSRRKRIESDVLGLSRLRTREGIYPSVRFGIESALLHLSAKLGGEPICNHLSESPLPEVHVNGLLIDTPNHVARHAKDYVERGYECIKLKAGRSGIEDDIRAVRAVREAVPDSVVIRVDANQQWDLDAAVSFAEAVADCRIEYIEEPLRRSEQLPEFRERTGMAYAIDETLCRLGCQKLSLYLDLARTGRPSTDVWAPVLMNAAAWIVKPSLLGMPVHFGTPSFGTLPPGLKLVLTASFESGLGLGILTNIASSLVQTPVPMGFDTHAWFIHDIVGTEFPISRGRISVAGVNEMLDRFHHERSEALVHV